MPSFSIAERLLTGDSSATMALPDWQSGENAKNYTDFLATTQQRLTSNELKQRHPFTIGNRFYLRRIAYLTLAHHRKRTSYALRMLLAQILTYIAPTRCNAPIQWNWILWLEKPKPSQQLWLLSTEADRSRPKPIKADFLMHLMHLTPNSQRYLSNKIN